MSAHRLSLLLSLLLVSTFPVEVKGAERGLEDLRPGLVASYRDKAKPQPREVVRLEPLLALALQPGEAPHPRLQTDGGTVVWKGHLNIVRAGKYRFAIRLRGHFRLQVAGKELLKAESPETALKQGTEVELEAGLHPLEAEFTRLPGVARVEVFWKGPGLREEPLPFDVLGHVPAQAPARLKADTLVEHGRFLAEELNCLKCHQSEETNKIARNLGSRLGPDLSQVGRRAYPGWIYRWLESPRKLRPGTVMPEMFSSDQAGAVERYAVARYLASLGGPVKASAKPLSVKEQLAAATKGLALFSSTGCTACHNQNNPDEKTVEGSLYGLLSPGGAKFSYPLSGMGSKTTPEMLAKYLLDPLAIDPSGRMPHMLLQGKEADLLARFLCQFKDESISGELPAAPAKEQMLAAFGRVEKRAEELAEFRRLQPDAQWLDLGKRLVIDKGCNNCHTIAPDGKPFATMQASADLNDLFKKDRQKEGCLAEQAEKRGQAPWFSLSARDREALRAFLNEGLTGAGSPAPTYAARLDLKRFNCLACHSRDGEGGLSTEQVEGLRLQEKPENAEMITPPPLTGVGHRLRTSWLRQVLTGAGRARPWMGLRMPQFGPAQVGKLSEALAALEGTEADDAVHKVALTPAGLEAGRLLVGKNGFGCISCHDLAGIPNTGTRGPDLGTSHQRVRYDWYLRWLEQPQRMVPGTKMPSVFPGGKSLLDKVLDGSAEAQSEAMWGYLALGSNLPLPTGMEPPKGLMLTVQDRPILLRTFLPEAGSRAIALGFPGGVSAAFDAHTGRLAYAWSGNFLDATPVWGGRGGNPAKLLGSRFWTAPPGCPVGLSPNSDPPDFLKRATDPAYGGTLPEGKLYNGPNLLRFLGYGIDKKGLPSFRYEVQSNDSEDVVEVSEQVEPLTASVAAGLKRSFTLQVPPRRNGYLFVGQTTSPPRLLDGKGSPVALELKGELFEVSVEDRMLVLPQDGDKVVVLTVPRAPEHSTWQLKRQGNSWQAVLRLPPLAEQGKLEVQLGVWVPYRDDPAFLKGLAGK